VVGPGTCKSRPCGRRYGSPTLSCELSVTVRDPWVTFPATVALVVDLLDRKPRPRKGDALDLPSRLIALPCGGHAWTWVAQGARWRGRVPLCHSADDGRLRLDHAARAKRIRQRPPHRAPHSCACSCAASGAPAHEPQYPPSAEHDSLGALPPLGSAGRGSGAPSHDNDGLEHRRHADALSAEHADLHTGSAASLEQHATSSPAGSADVIL